MADIRLVHSGVTEQQHRSIGPHVSPIINDLCILYGHYEPSDNPPRVRMELGCVMEFAIAQRYVITRPEEQWIQVGELEKDGIYGTPDLYSIIKERVKECKLVWMSSKHGPDSEKLWKFLAQLKAYCEMMETRLGELDITYIIGDYGEGGDSVRNVYEIEFTRQELLENWMMIKSHGERMRKEGRL
jgi:hypothetical protein